MTPPTARPSSLLKSHMTNAQKTIASPNNNYYPTASSPPPSPPKNRPSDLSNISYY